LTGFAEDCGEVFNLAKRQELGGGGGNWSAGGGIDGKTKSGGQRKRGWSLTMAAAKNLKGVIKGGKLGEVWTSATGIFALSGETSGRRREMVTLLEEGALEPVKDKHLTVTPKKGHIGGMTERDKS